MTITAPNPPQPTDTIRPMRILYLATEMGLGGAEVVARTLFNEWAARGHTPHLLLTYKPGVNAKRIQADGHNIEALDLPGGPRMLLKISSVRERVKAINPDVIIINNQDVLLPWAWTLGGPKKSTLGGPKKSTLGGPKKSTLGGPKSSTLGGKDVPVFAVIHSTEAGKFRPSDLIHRLFLPRYQKVITLGEPHAQYAMQRFGLARDKLAVIHNGVEAIVPKPLEKPLPELPNDALVGVIAARLHPDKNHMGLLEATKLVLEKHPNFHVLALGQGDQRDSLEAHAKKLGIADHVHFLGARGDVGAILERAHLGLISSITTETLSIAVLEYMRAGLPVVSTRLGSLEDQVLNGKTGFLVPPGDDRALAQAISKMLENPKLREQFGTAGKALQQQEFTSAKMSEGYLKLFQKSLSR
jgi:glycosyltransferase involved in cell wall biosynthesis